MYRKWIGLLVAIFGLLTACGDDGAGPDGPNVADLAGNWELTLFEWRNDANPLETVDGFQEVGLASVTLVIEENGRFVLEFVFSDGANPIQATGSISLSQTTLTFDYDDAPPFTVSYSLSGDVLTLTHEDAEFDFDDDQMPDPATTVLIYERT